MLESTYQAKLIKKLHAEFPGCIVLKNDTDYIQGFPDLTVLYKSRWAVLEVKPSASAANQPNQEYYVQVTERMSFGGFVYPENEYLVFQDLRRHFGVR